MKLSIEALAKFLAITLAAFPNPNKCHDFLTVLIIDMEKYQKQEISWQKFENSVKLAADVICPGINENEKITELLNLLKAL